ncbi:MAG: pilus assembly protein CpaB [Actinomycetota bacterium]|nr:pilus assembly protein CpaB [Actinomycetota bacterium]
MGRRTLLVIASLLIATVGTALIWVYARGADERARRDWAEPVTVLVATEPIEIGATRSEVAKHAKPRQIPRLLAPEHRLTGLEAIGARATSIPVLAGQYLVEGQFSAESGASGVTENRMGLAVQLEDPNRVASLLRPDSRVAVYAVTPTRTGTSVVFLLNDVRVIAVGGASTVRGADGARARVGTQADVSTALVTLDVDGAQATRLMAYHEFLYFTLLGRNAKGSLSDNFSHNVPLAGARA